MKKENKYTYVGGDSAEQLNLDDRDIQIIEEAGKEKKKKIIIAVSAAALAVIVVAVYLAVTIAGAGASRSRKLVETYMAGLADADIDKVKSVMDSDTLANQATDSLIQIFQTYKESDEFTYTVDYSMGDGYKADSSNLEAVSNTLYSKSAKSAGVVKGYVIPVSITMNLSYKGTTTPNSVNLNIICYEKDGEWYLGGTIEDETDGGQSE